MRTWLIMVNTSARSKEQSEVRWKNSELVDEIQAVPNVVRCIAHKGTEDFVTAEKMVFRQETIGRKGIPTL